jgi:glutathione synthase/RimK-type ligase-like ATP-grasp enzyme
MNYILVGKNGYPSMSALWMWLVEAGCDIKLIKQLYGKEKKSKAAEYSIYSFVNDRKIVEDSNGIRLTDKDVLIRWGSRSYINEGEAVVFNKCDALKKASNKLMFRKESIKNFIKVPFTVTKLDELFGLNYSEGVVIRPEQHRAGQNYIVVDTPAEATRAIRKLDCKWYASEFIDKTNEYRVQYAFGRILSVKEKPKPEATAKKNRGPWNFAVNEDDWTYIAWGDYDINMVHEVVKSAESIGIDFCAFDVMKDKNGQFYILEANTAPTLSPYTIDRFSYLFKGILNGDVDIFSKREIDVKNPKDYVWKNKHLKKEKQNAN